MDVSGHCLVYSNSHCHVLLISMEFIETFPHNRVIWGFLTMLLCILTKTFIVISECMFESFSFFYLGFTAVGKYSVSRIRRKWERSLLRAREENFC